MFVMIRTVEQKVQSKAIKHQIASVTIRVKDKLSVATAPKTGRQKKYSNIKRYLVSRTYQL